MRIIIFFLFLVPALTMTHQLAHFITAKSLDQNAKLHYNNMSYNSNFSDSILKEMTLTKKENFAFKKKIKKENFLISLSAPVSIFCVGVIAFIGFLYYKNKISTNTLIIIYGFTLFTSHFIYHFIKYFLLKDSNAFYNSDEYKIAQYSNIPPKLLYIAFLIPSLLIVFYSTIIVLRKTIWKEFLCKAFLGIFFGYLLWFYGIGEFILP